MLITKRTYKKNYVTGGAGIFGTIGNFFARMFSSNAEISVDSSSGMKNCSERYRNECY